MHINLEFFPSFGREKQHKTGKQWASPFGWEGQQERNISPPSPSFISCELSCVETCSSHRGRRQVPAEHLCQHKQQPFSGDLRMLMDPVPLLHSSWQREAWAAFLCNLVLYRSHGGTITVTAEALLFGAHNPCNSLTSAKVLGLVQALRPSENRLPTHASTSMSH